MKKLYKLRFYVLFVFLIASIGLISFSLFGQSSEAQFKQTTGKVLLPDGNLSAPGLAFASGETYGIYKVGSELHIVCNGAEALQVTLSHLRYYRNSYFSLGTSADVRLYRDAAYIPAFRLDANAHTLRIYGTYTDTDNYERLSLSTTIGSGVTIAAETAGSGGDNLNITLIPAGTGAILPGSDDTVNLGSGTMQFKEGWFDGTIVADAFRCDGDMNFNGIGSSVVLSWSWDTSIGSDEAGGLEIFNANNDDNTKLKIYGSAKTLTESTATSIATLVCDTNEYIGGVFEATIYATDGTDLQTRSQSFNFTAINKAGTVTCNLGTVNESISSSSGTLTCTPTITQNGDAVDIQLNATSSLTQTTLETRWQVRINGNAGAVTAL